MESGIYYIINSFNGKFYIGQAQNFAERFSNHRIALRKGNHENRHLQNAFNKYGEVYFTFHIVMRVKEEFLDRYEQWQLDQHWETGRLYNLSPTAGSNRGYEWTDEQRETLSQAMKGLKRSEEHCQRISETLKGRKYSEEHCQNISRAKIGNQVGAKRWEISNPGSDEWYEIFNLAKFCREHKLDSGAMVKVALGERKHHKGYRCRRLN
jgi:group I intron endonuclease